MADGLAITGAEWFSQVVIPFVLVFTLFFAILEKSKILGEKKHQLNSIISLSMGLIIVGVGVTRDMINDIIPVVAVVAIVIFVFMLLVGFTAGKEGALIQDGGLNKTLQIVIGIIVGIVLISTILWSSGKIPVLSQFFKSDGNAPVFQSIVFLIITAVVVAILFTSTKGDKKE
ncbi:MAG: hypothetical protein V1660_01870 [archaeon]